VSADRAVGADGYPRGWVAVSLLEGRFERVALCPSFGDVLEEFPDAGVFGVDIPIGAGPREADRLARARIGPRRGRSVFPAPTEEALRATAFAETTGVSRQLFALFPKIREVAVHAQDPRVIEVHPEVSFWALKGAELEAAKTTWNGFLERRRLLRAAGIELPDALEPDPPLIDVLDAAAAAWSARRYARTEAGRLGEGPTIWY
jgi:predicted RNase H-like nuclease